MSESSSYWRSAVLDEEMQDEHGFVWKAMLDTIDVDLAGKRVLDAGCNRGGFLRLVSDAFAIAEGRGYDPASGAIDDARRLAGNRPLRFEVADSVPAGWRSFDVAFSHEVLYLIHDLSGHAKAIFDALAPGGSYYAVMGVHADSPLMVEWHRANVEELHLPKLYNLDEVAGARLKIGFVPASGHTSADHAGTFLRWIEYYSDDKLLLRCTRPPLPG